MTVRYSLSESSRGRLRAVARLSDKPSRPLNDPSLPSLIGLGLPSDQGPVASFRGCSLTTPQCTTRVQLAGCAPRDPAHRIQFPVWTSFTTHGLFRRQG